MLPSVLGYARVSFAGGEPREGHFTAPDLPLPPLAGAASNATASAPGFYQTSEYMIGSVAVGLILPESNGAIDAELSDWTPEQRRRVLDEVQAGLDWFSRLAPEARLSFVIDDHATNPIATGYEPITHPQYQEGLWIGATLSSLGYSDGSHWTRVRQYVNDLRNTYHTDWAFAIFVVNSHGDPDSAFTDRYFAYAYIGGPFLVMTYDNAGYGIGNMDAVTAHETGHIFRALDQYSSANVACTARSGYLGIETQNSQQSGCASNVSSIMRGGIYPFAANAIDPYASGQIGWHDSDHDGIFDPVDTLPSLTIDSTARDADTWRYAGHAFDSPYPSPLRPAATTNDVSVEYRVGGGEWMPAVPADGSFDSPDESFTLSVSPYSSGNHRVTFRARNTVGNVSVATAYIVVPDPIDAGLDTWLEAPVAGLSGGARAPSLQGVASSFNADGTPGTAVARVEYRIDGGEWQPAQSQDGRFDSAEEAFVIPLDRQGGTYLVDARAVDANGKIEQNSAGLEISIKYAVFIPVVHK
jgi:hypothetical protein